MTYNWTAAMRAPLPTVRAYVHLIIFISKHAHISTYTHMQMGSNKFRQIQTRTGEKFLMRNTAKNFKPTYTYVVGLVCVYTCSGTIKNIIFLSLSVFLPFTFHCLLRAFFYPLPMWERIGGKSPIMEYIWTG